MQTVDFEHWPYPAFVAHRGAGTLAPENTLAAMRVGYDHGYRMFEFDVKLSGDGVLLLMHDPLVDRTTNGQGRVGGLRWGEISRLDAGGWYSPRFAGEPVPSFEQAARWLKANECFANIEIKPCPGREAETGAAAALEAMSLWHRLECPPLLSSFSEEALAAARRAAPVLPRALLLAELPDDWLDRCRALECVALDVHHRALDAALISYAHQAGLRVLGYTINDPERAGILREAGIDCVITDAVDRISPASGSAGPATARVGRQSSDYISRAG
jgi:glycerophosphoryl diester phosphodiesterase